MIRAASASEHQGPLITLPGPLGASSTAVCIDTATDMASVALLRDGAVVAEQTWLAGRAHTKHLSVTLRRLAEESGFELTAVNMLCVCTGPGSFNGIRAGMATALGLAYGLKAPIYGASSLDLIAFPHADRASAQRAILPAGRNEYYSALFGARGGRWRRLSSYVIEDLETLVADSPDRCLWAGTLNEEEVIRLATLLGGARRLVAPTHNVRRAAFLLPLALAEAASGGSGSSSALTPVYLRRPAITSPRSSSV